MDRDTATSKDVIGTLGGSEALAASGVSEEDACDYKQYPSECFELCRLVGNILFHAVRVDGKIVVSYVPHNYINNVWVFIGNEAKLFNRLELLEDAVDDVINVVIRELTSN